MRPIADSRSRERRKGDRRQRFNIQHFNRVHGSLALKSPGDAGLFEVVRGHFHFHAVADGEADKAFSHLAGDGGEDEVFVVQFHAKHGAG